jgi:hypothetical protein
MRSIGARCNKRTAEANQQKQANKSKDGEPPKKEERVNGNGIPLQIEENSIERTAQRRRNVFSGFRLASRLHLKCGQEQE